MKIAVLFFGQLRIAPGNNLNYDSLIKFIKAKNPTVDTIDIYSHCWFDSDAKNYDISPWVPHSSSNVFSDIPNFILHKYKPIKILFEKPKTFCNILSDKYQSNGCTRWTDMQLSNMISQLYSVQSVCNLVPDNYDFYILTRYDLEYLDFPDLSTIKNTENTRESDLLEIFGSNNLLAYRNLIDNLKYINKREIDAEYLRHHSLEKNEIKSTVIINLIKFNR